jgi:hypothetical protein
MRMRFLAPGQFIMVRAPKDLAVALARPSCVRHLFLLTLQKGQ